MRLQQITLRQVSIADKKTKKAWKDGSVHDIPQATE